MPVVTYTRATSVAELPGLSPAAAAVLQRQGLRTAGQLAAAVKNGTITSVPAITRAYAQHPPVVMSLALAKEIGRKLLRGLRSAHPALAAQSTIVGSLRRNRPRIGDIDILVAIPCTDIDLDAAVRRAHGTVLATFARGPARCSCILQLLIRDRPIRVAFDLFSAPPTEWGTALLHHTGSSQFNIRMRAHAKAVGYSLSQHGLKSLSTGRVRRFMTEAAVFAALRMANRPPEMRQR
jgi:DNA polymerase/3'-5' exonuclease PolX